MLLIGCSSGLDVTPVSGTITLDGQPLDGATVQFMSQSSSGKATNGMGATGSDGKYSVTTGQGESGLLPGTYKVTVSKKQLPKGLDTEVGGIDVERLKELVPPQYSHPEKTTLTATIDSDPKPVDFTLISKK